MGIDLIVADFYMDRRGRGYSVHSIKHRGVLYYCTGRLASFKAVPRRFARPALPRRAEKWEAELDLAGYAARKGFQLRGKKRRVSQVIPCPAPPAPK